MSAEKRLVELGIVLPQPSRPGGPYVPAVIARGMVYLAAQFPIENGVFRFVGRLGAELDVEQGRAAARLAGLNVLSHLRLALGSLDRVKRLVRVEGHLLTAPGFTQHARVLDGASELFNEVFGERGAHARAVYGHATLPVDLALELVVIAEADPEPARPSSTPWFETQ